MIVGYWRLEVEGTVDEGEGDDKSWQTWVLRNRARDENDRKSPGLGIRSDSKPGPLSKPGQLPRESWA
ncbi:hypothetical protein PIB30_073184 [Stylosanthes scabra]|uniref:Uncharacterized protein n=1 Tax=Stylosanthes scabra TaxID=79078 RepID=A0ABU6UQB4_9FABA|nr:hypothetical protein [Stylosanthes scabra]